MNDTTFEEDLSISYLRAVAVKAEVKFNLFVRDSVSKDALLSKLVYTEEGFPIEVNIFVQLKATCSQYEETENEIKYDLKVKNYNDLCMAGNVKILCLLILPHDCSEWVNQTADELVLKRCMYWTSFAHEAPTSNTSTIRVTIPKKRMLTVEALNDMIYTLANGGEL